MKRLSEVVMFILYWLVNQGIAIVTQGCKKVANTLFILPLTRRTAKLFFRMLERKVSERLLVTFNRLAVPIYCRIKFLLLRNKLYVVSDYGGLGWSSSCSRSQRSRGP